MNRRELEEKKNSLAIFICENSLKLKFNETVADRIEKNIKQIDDYLFEYFGRIYLVYASEEELDSFIRDYLQFFAFQNIPSKFRKHFNINYEQILKESFETKRELVLSLCCKDKQEEIFPFDYDYYVCELIN